MNTAELQLVPFRGGAIEAVMHDGRPWCAVRSICLALDLDVKNQHVKLKAKPWACVVLITTQLPGDSQAREVLCIDLDSLPMWLATIEPGRVKPAARDALVAYQREAARVLRDHFLGKGAAAPASGPLSTVDTQTEVKALTKEVLNLRRDLRRLVLPTPSEVPAQAVTAAEVLQIVKTELAAHRGLMTSEEVASFLGISLKRWQEIYRNHATLRRTAAIELGTRGPGQEMRWDIAQVMQTLNRRLPAAGSLS